VRERFCPAFYRLFWIIILLLPSVKNVNAAPLSPGQMESRLRAGVNLFSQGKYREAVPELRRFHAEAPSAELRGEALFWISLSELSAGEYAEALQDMDALIQTDPAHRRVKELSYQRGRVLYYLGRYDEAIVQLKGYADSLAPDAGAGLDPSLGAKKVSALYWIGECLFSMDQLDKAADVFHSIIEDYPGNVKYEASVYRLALIDQKKVEAELLNLLKLSHEESLRNTEEFRQKEINYDQALNAYQKRISEILAQSAEDEKSRTVDEESGARYREQLAAAEERIRTLENILRETTSSLDSIRNAASVERLKTLKSSAQDLEALIAGSGK